MIAGTLAAALAGAVEGALAGSAGAALLGALFGGAIEKQHLLKYDVALRAGQVLLSVTGPREQIEKARALLADRTSDLDLHVETITETVAVA